MLNFLVQKKEKWLQGFHQKLVGMYSDNELTNLQCDNSPFPTPLLYLGYLPFWYPRGRIKQDSWD